MNSYLFTYWESVNHYKWYTKYLEKGTDAIDAQSQLESKLKKENNQTEYHLHDVKRID